MEERGFFCFMAPVYLLAPNMLLTFLIIFTPSISPSKTAMPVLKARIMALPLSAAGARGGKQFSCRIRHDFFLYMQFLP